MRAWSCAPVRREMTAAAGTRRSCPPRRRPWPPCEGHAGPVLPPASNLRAPLAPPLAEKTDADFQRAIEKRERVLLALGRVVQPEHDDAEVEEPEEARAPHDERGPRVRRRGLGDQFFDKRHVPQRELLAREAQRSDLRRGAQRENDGGGDEPLVRRQVLELALHECEELFVERRLAQ